MKNLFSLILLQIFVVSCNQDIKKEKSSENEVFSKPKIAQIKEENYDISNDSIIFNSASIENFDTNGHSIDVYWIGEKKDTVLRFYRKYDENKNLIGAEYYEQGDTEPSRDTVYFNADGLKVEASLNPSNQITWKSTISTDPKGNPVLKTYENGKGEYRGLDSLFFDEKNREIKGFYKNAKGKRYSIRTYQYLKSDIYDNWTERKMFVNDTLKQTQIRKIEYYD